MRLALPLLLGLVVVPSCDRIPGLKRIPGLRGCDSSTRVTREGKPTSVDCSVREGRPPREDCLTKRISCGDTVKNTTAGGTSTYGDEFYRDKYCTPFTEGYAGPERVYLIELPAQTLAEFWLDGECADLDLFVFHWSFDGTCPGLKHPISECEADVGRKSPGHVHVETVIRPGEYFVVVDGKDGVTAPFALTVECSARS